ncbi:MAG: hypothetical protein L0I88_02955 [Alkalibacterium sp.]|nr:hypothetical protein [Alkalibacterium sp.]
MDKIKNLFQDDLKAVALGIEFIKDDLEIQGAEVTQLDWQPPASGDSH